VGDVCEIKFTKSEVKRNTTMQFKMGTYANISILCRHLAKHCGLSKICHNRIYFMFLLSKH